MLDALKWCGIMPTEGPGIGGEFGPYIQSERKEMYKQWECQTGNTMVLQGLI